ncbi:MAG: pyridoxamine 5'-phosphate oxidase family protein [Bacteroidota bacterium]|nr:pyridoxamine 5'-phosphate oxidase family protein [Bacteroidota bacterium]
MDGIDKGIVTFINNHHVLTLATCSENEPWCANCFYVYVEDMNLFVFTSDDTTKHIQDVLTQDLVAGSIVLETTVIGKIRGIQFQGKMWKPEGALLKKVKTAYLKRFPIAMLLKTNLWVIDPILLKYTDNRLGFGKKLIWTKGNA